MTESYGGPCDSWPRYVADAGFLPTTRRMAWALGSALTGYMTPLAVTPRSRLLKMPALGPEFRRRMLPTELVGRTSTVASLPELARIGMTRLGGPRLGNRFLWRKNEIFDRAVALRIPRDSHVVAQFGAALETFGAVNGTRFLDYPIARYQQVHQLLDEEAERWPAFAKSIDGGARHAATPGQLERIDKEVACADVVVVGSRFAAASFAGVIPPHKIRVVPYGVDTDRFFPGDTRNNGPLRILFAGQISQRKGIAYLLEALKLLPRGSYVATLVGPIIHCREALAPYADLFVHRPVVRPLEMPAVYRDSDVLVLPSVAEGSALVVLEALASGIPAIVTLNTGADAVHDNVDGFVVPMRDPPAIAERLTRLIDDRDLLHSLSLAARRRGVDCDWSEFRRCFRDLAAEMMHDGVGFEC